MYNNFILNNVRYSLVKVKDILNIYSIPKYSKKLINNNLNELNNKMIFKFQPITPLYFVLFKNQRYIIDGLHRLEIYKNNHLLQESIIPIVDILAEEYNDINTYFDLVNKNNKIIKNTNEITDIIMEEYDEKKEIIINNVYNYFLNNYPNSFKFNGKRRPYINSDKFIEILEIIYSKYNIECENIFIQKLLDLNTKYKKQKIEWFPSKSKVLNESLIELIKNENCLYFGMVPDEWYNHLDKLPKYISEEKISQSLRQQVWTKLEIKCICCNLNTINAFTFESGHIIPRSKGGECNIDNLAPICGLCNKSMGNINMKEFMINHNYKLHKLFN